jgi:hypothetical protein
MMLASPRPASKIVGVYGWALRLWLVWPLLREQFVGVDAQSCAPGTAKQGVSCVPCPSSFFCPGGATPALPCYAGAYCSANASNAIVCPSGSYCPASSSAPVLCPSGQVSVVGSSVISNCMVLPLFVSTFAGHAASAQSGLRMELARTPFFRLRGVSRLTQRAQFLWRTVPIKPFVKSHLREVRMRTRKK